MTVTHPAKYSDLVLDRIREVLDGRKFRGTILDPFAGVGKIHDLAIFGERTTFGVELEIEWADAHPRTVCGDATDLQFPAGSFEAVITSPPYATRMADNYAGDPKGSTRHTYRISLERPLTGGSAAAMQWGPEYRSTMRIALEEIWRVLDEGGLFILNISDHIRKGELQLVPNWYAKQCSEIGFQWEEEPIEVNTPRLRHGQNYEKRATAEYLFVMTKPYKETTV